MTRSAVAVAQLVAAQDVIALATDQMVLALAAADDVVAVVAGELVVVGRSGQVLDVDQRVGYLAGRTGIGRGAVFQACRDGAADVGEVRRVDAVAAIGHVGAATAAQDVVTVAAHEVIGAAAADQQVVAVEALQFVGTTVAEQLIAVLRTGEVLEVLQLLDDGDVRVWRVTGDTRAQVGDHRRTDVGEVRGVDAVAAVGDVLATAAADHVVAVAADQGVGTAAAGQDVVLVAAEQRVIAATALDFAFDRAVRTGLVAVVARTEAHVADDLTVVDHGEIAAGRRGVDADVAFDFAVVPDLAVLRDVLGEANARRSFGDDMTLIDDVALEGRLATAGARKDTDAVAGQVSIALTPADHLAMVDHRSFDDIAIHLAGLQGDAGALIALSGVDQAASMVGDRVVLCRGVGVDRAVALVARAEDVAEVVQIDTGAVDVHGAAVALDRAVVLDLGIVFGVAEVEAVVGAVDQAVAVVDEPAVESEAVGKADSRGRPLLAF